MVQIWHPTSVETCMWGKRLATMLATYISKGVTPEVNLRECISRMPLPSMNKVAYFGFETQSKHHQGYQWPQKWTCVQQFFLKNSLPEMSGRRLTMAMKLKNIIFIPQTIFCQRMLFRENKLSKSFF